MLGGRLSASGRLVVAVLTGLIILAWAPASMAADLTTLSSLRYIPDGGGPQSGVVRDASGALYGTTSRGGTGDGGIAFRLSPPEARQKQWKETILHKFSGRMHGEFPYYGLARADDGTLYGSTAQGGIYDHGMIFALIPPVPGSTKWQMKVLADFPAAGPLMIGRNGTLYGLEWSGTIFRLAPPPPGSTRWKKHVLYIFGGPPDGEYPSGRLIMDRSGTLYGTTYEGGIYDRGTVFRLTPSASGMPAWKEEVLYSFKDSVDGFWPMNGVTIGSDGTLYGTAVAGGEFSQGAVFSLTPPAPGKTRWKAKVLHSFADNPDGANPSGGLIVDEAGVLYGMTCLGGPTNDGTIYSLTPLAPGSRKWTETVLHSFNHVDGRCPIGDLTRDSEGNFYATTSQGGAYESGTVFKLVP